VVIFGTLSVLFGQAKCSRCRTYPKVPDSSQCQI
jgi:hypothetical protein